MFKRINPLLFFEIIQIKRTCKSVFTGSFFMPKKVLYMKYDMCMRRECKNCYKQVECFKKEGKNESEKIKNRGFKNSDIQSQKRTNRKR